tara:strand:+ start:18116 stop:19252 length:1137 start_codon:yes stop_codon:yes gene_type:complete
VTSRYIPIDDQLVTSAPTPTELANFGYSYERGAIQGVTGVASRGFSDLVESESKKEFDAWFQGDGHDITASFETKSISSKGGWTVLPYLLTLTLIPALDTTQAETILTLKSDETVLYQHREQFTTKSALGVYFPTPLFFGSMGKGPMQTLVRDQLARHQLALQEFIAANRAEYEQVVAAGTVEAYRTFLKDNPDSFFRMETLRRLSEQEPKQKALAFHRENLNIDPAYLVYLPDRYDVWFSGPKEMPVHEVLRLSRESDEVLLVSRIKAAGQPYKIFSSDEIDMLKEGGLSSSLIAAMIDVSAQTSSPTQTSAAAATAAGTGAPTPAGGPASAGDIAAQCAKRFAAMKMCDQVPSFGATICRSQVAKKFNHIACSAFN